MTSERPDGESFEIIGRPEETSIHDEYTRLFDAHLGEPSTFMLAALRHKYPEHSVTVNSPQKIPLLNFAFKGHANAQLDIKTEEVQSFRYFLAGNQYQGVPDRLVDAIQFAKYDYTWNEERYIVYVMALGIGDSQYILKEPGPDETVQSTNAATDRLLWAVGQWVNQQNYIYVFDGFWAMSQKLYEEVQKARWADVILEETMKQSLKDLLSNFFDSKETYNDLGVPWKRGVIFHGPAGNGKTISLKAMMHSLFQRSGFSIASLYVKAARSTYEIKDVFNQARRLAPCMLILEDIDTIVTEGNRSYFFNEMDGLESNDGIFIVATTNYLEQLDPGLSSRPSRFDRKILFPLPSYHERVLYCHFWKHKLRNKPSVEFPEKLCPAIANITDDFSFAYLKEAFVATLLVIAAGHEDRNREAALDDLDRYELWREIKRQVQLLRREMQSSLVGRKETVTRSE